MEDEKIRAWNDLKDDNFLNTKIDWTTCKYASNKNKSMLVMLAIVFSRITI